MNSENLISVIGADRSHRAIDLVVLSLRGLASLAETNTEKKHVVNTARALQQARPRAVPLRNILDEFCLRLEQSSDDDLFAAVTAVCDGLAAAMIDKQDTVAAKMAAKIGDGQIVMSLSMSSTIRRVFDLVNEQGRSVHAIVPESRPACEGRLLAEHLSALGVPATFITEAQVAVFMRNTDQVILGADRLLPAGGAVNKAGSLLMALAARHFNVPLYICAESFKRGSDDKWDDDDMDVAELDLPPLAGVTPRNVYLEEVPADLITETITDE